MNKGFSLHKIKMGNICRQKRDKSFSQISPRFLNTKAARQMTEKQALFLPPWILTSVIFHLSLSLSLSLPIRVPIFLSLSLSLKSDRKKRLLSLWLFFSALGFPWKGCQVFRQCLLENLFFLLLPLFGYVRSLDKWFLPCACVRACSVQPAKIFELLVKRERSAFLSLYLHISEDTKKTVVSPFSFLLSERTKPMFNTGLSFPLFLFSLPWRC